MAFNAENLEGKLKALSASQQSVQTLSLWLVHHHEHADAITAVWLRELAAAPPPQQLGLMYLANDTILQSRKRGAALKDAFGEVLEEAIITIYAKSSRKTRAMKYTLMVPWQRVHYPETSGTAIERLIDIWDERGAYSQKTCAAFRLACTASQAGESAAAAVSGIGEGPADASPTVGEDESATAARANAPKIDLAILQATLQSEQENAVSYNELLQSALRLPAELCSEKNASAVGDMRLVSHLEQQAVQCRAALNQAEAAADSIIETKRGNLELLETALWQQRADLAECSERLAVLKSKLSGAKRVKRELRVHIKNLPQTLDFSTEELAPLGSAAELFGDTELG